MMASFHAGYSIGGVAGALLGSAMAGIKNISVLIHFLLITTAFSTAAYILNKYLQSVEISKQNAAKKSLFRLPERPIWIMGIIALASAFGEGTAADWSAIFIRNELGTNASTAALGFAAFSLTVTVVRLFGDWLVMLLKPRLVVRLEGLVAGAGFFLAAWTNYPSVAIFDFGLVGLGLANIIPQLFSTAGNIPGLAPGIEIAGFATIGYAGFLLAPPLVGTISNFFHSGSRFQ